jgi:hypothetical protein
MPEIPGTTDKGAGLDRWTCMLVQEKRTDDGLSPEEQDYLLGKAPREDRVERRRPGWMVVGMVWATFGIYFIIWSGLHWAEMKRQLRDERMYPIWHALAMFVPIYMYFRFHANFRVLNELLATTRSSHRVRPLLVVATLLAANALLAIPIDDMTLMTLNVIAAIAVISWIIHHGQTGMNAYWDAMPSQKTTERVKLWERVVIAAGAAMWSLIILSVLFGLGES